MHPRGYFFGIILISIGLLIILDNMFGFDISDLISTFWPLLLILVGWKLLKQSNFKLPNVKTEPAPKTESQSGTHSEVNFEEDYLNVTNVFGDTSQRVESKDFRGGSITTLFGDTHLNLSEIDIKQQERAVNITSIFGDVHVTLPKGFAFRLRGNSVIGDISIAGEKTDGFFRHLSFRTEGYSEAEKQLKIYVSSILGDIHIA